MIGRRAGGPGQFLVGVVGAGAMGSGIALTAARAGHPVRLHDASAGAVERGLAGLAAQLARQVEKGRLDAAERNRILARIRPAEALSDLAQVDMVIEAIVEDAAVKAGLFAALEGVVGAETILATNTSSLSVTALGGALRRPGRFVGLHFFNPAAVMPLVEVVSGEGSRPEVADLCVALAAAWGKTPVRCRSTPGFIVNRVARPFYGEALRLLEEQVASPATIDAIMRDAGGFRMGPFELMDMIGHDVNFAVTSSVYEGFFHDPRYRPSLAQKALVEAGRLGRKSGQGFYDHALPPPPPDDAPLVDAGPGVACVGRAGVLEPLVARAEAAGLRLERGWGGRTGLAIGAVHVLAGDGRTAAAVSARLNAPVVLIDGALDLATAARVAISHSPGVDPQPVIAFLQGAGLVVNLVADTPGMVVTRTVAMIANEAIDVVHLGVASATDVDTSMVAGVNYPIGPIAWMDRVGRARTGDILDRLAAYYADGRYRPAPPLRQAMSARDAQTGSKT